MLELAAVVLGLSLLFWCVSGYSLGNKRAQSWRPDEPYTAMRQSAEVRKKCEAMKAESELRAEIRKNFGYHQFSDGRRCSHCGIRKIDYLARDIDGRSVKCPSA